MAARNEEFPWLSHYGHYKFFESQLSKHSKVSNLEAQSAGIYELSRPQGDTIRVFICECYAFGTAEYLETIDKLGHLDAVIINSAWCGYSHDAKNHCRDENVGLFTIGEFMAALNRDDYWMYLTEKEKEYFEEQGWL